LISAIDWAPWKDAVKSDVLVEEARSVWPVIRCMYSAQFAVYTDDLIRNFQAEQAPRTDTSAAVRDQIDC